jgi:hypothetical protein
VIPADEFRFLCETPDEFAECCALIADNELELVGVVAIARPTESSAPTEQLLLIFGAGQSGDGDAAA